MALFYITGTSGSGKSSVRERLERLGYEVHDTDISINDWYDRQTDQKVNFSPVSSEQTTHWVKVHDFLMSEHKIKQLVARARSVDIFICGHATNDVDMMSYFQKVFCLFLNEEETKKRLLSRTNNTWGNDPKQLIYLMKWYKPTIERYKRVGATMIDATHSVDTVVDHILTLTKS
ncbi:MAG: hypothetical protein NVSMB46_06990 [Candidatus Saccharimonadales bacterium]